MQDQNNQGNVLFLILIAVVLFAALSYAVTSSSRSGSGSISKEKISLIIGQLENIAASYRGAVLRMTAGGVSLADIDCVNDTLQSNNGYAFCRNEAGKHNENCTTDNCQIYHPNGGGVIPNILSRDVVVDFPTYIAGNPKLGHATRIVGASVPDLGTVNNESLLVFYNVRKEICLAFNQKHGINNPGGEPPTDSGCCGTYSFQDGNASFMMTNIDLSGKTEFCVSRDGETDWNNRVVFVLGVR